MIKIESIRISVIWRFPYSIEVEELKTIKEEITNYVSNILENHSIKETDADIAVISTEKHISEILYEETNYRIIKTKTQKAVLQKKSSYSSDKKTGFIWKDHSFNNAIDDKQALNACMKELKRLKSKGTYTSRKPTKRSRFLEHLSDKDKALLGILVNEPTEDKTEV